MYYVRVLISNYKLQTQEGRGHVSSSALYLWCLTEDLHVLGAQLTFWMKEMEAVWVLNFSCHVTAPGWTLCSHSVTSTGCSHVIS